jgi:hypothetical protein
MPALAELGEFRQAVADFPAGESGAGESGAGEFEVAAEPAARAAAERSLAESGFLLLGEVHGVLENPLIIQALLRMFGLTSLALEWEAGLAPVISAFLAGDELADHPGLWFGDGRITAGHLAVLRERATVGPLELTLMDETMMADASWSGRDEAMAARLLAGAGPGRRTLVVAGNLHTAVRPSRFGVPLGAVLAAHRPGVREIRIEYLSGRYYNVAPRRFRPRTRSRRPGPRLVLRNENLALVLPSAREAVVPQRSWPQIRR